MCTNKDGDLTAHNLSKINHKYIKLILSQDGEIESLTRLASQCVLTGTDYFHAVLRLENGLVYFDHLPYRASPYPVNDFEVDVYYNSSEDKYWAIADVANELLVIYKNDQTQQRWVVQKVHNIETLQERVQDKLKKHYVFQGTKTYCGINRTIR